MVYISACQARYDVGGLTLAEGLTLASFSPIGLQAMFALLRSSGLRRWKRQEVKGGSYDTYNSGLVVSCAVLLIHKLDG